MKISSIFICFMYFVLTFVDSNTSIFFGSMFVDASPEHCQKAHPSLRLPFGDVLRGGSATDLAAAGPAKSKPEAPSASNNGQIIKCAYSQDWDAQGVFYLLGSMPPLPPNLPAGAWANPSTLGRVRVHVGERGYLGLETIGEEEVQLDPSIVIDR